MINSVFPIIYMAYIINHSGFAGRAMNRLISFFIITLIAAQAFGADPRAERWNIRIDRMKKIQAAASTGKTDREILDRLASSGIKSSEEFLSILGRYSRDDGSLKEGAKKYSLTEIESRVKEVTFPAISLALLSATYSSAENSSMIENISADISSLASKEFGSAVRITPTDLHIIARDYIFEAAAGDYDSALKKAASEILSATEYELSRTDYNSNDADLLKIIARHTADKLSGYRYPAYTRLNESYLSATPRWRFINAGYSKTKKRNIAIMGFVNAGKGSLEANPMVKDADSAEDEIFLKAKSRLSSLLKNTTSTSGAAGNNPYYEIPDIGKLNLAIDEIDRYRRSMMKGATGNESREYISRITGNTTGIADRHSSRIDARFRNEDARIDRLKKLKGDIVIYNEEIFNAARSNFYEARAEINRYAKLSADFLEAYYSSGRAEPGEFISLHKYQTARYLRYLSFAEKLTSDTRTLSVSGLERFNAGYKGAIRSVLSSSKGLLKPEQIPPAVRGSLGRDELKEYAAINASFRTDGSVIINTIRKNYDECAAGFTRDAVEKKESALESEGRIAQDETDRLFAFARACAEALHAMNSTEKNLKAYSGEYDRITESLKKGERPAGLKAGKENTLISYIREFNPGAIERETATREIVAKEGMESLSGAITLAQHYKRRGIALKFEPTAQEVASIKLAFTRSPEVTVSSWRMNGKNFRQVDINVTAEIEKLMNSNAWNGNLSGAAAESVNIKGAGIGISFTPPKGWSRVPSQGDDHDRISYESPDKTGVIELSTIREEEQNIQSLASLWPEKQGYAMIEKSWGRKNNSDFIKCTSKNSFNRVMESYMIASKGRIIILSGKTSRELYRKLNRTLGEVFDNLEIADAPLKLGVK